MKHEKTVCITNTDAAKLARIAENLLRHSTALENGAEALHETLDAAHIVTARDVPADVVTMNSEALVEDAESGEKRAVTVVYPETADPGAGRISVLSPMGNALLGARTGDQVVVATPASTRIVKVMGVKFQPEAAGQYGL